MTKENKAMLAVPLGTLKVENLLADDAWGAQEKSDGHRVVIRTTPGKPVQVFNRAGEPRQHVIPGFMIEAFSKVPFSAVFDGELVGMDQAAKLWLFDLPLASTNVTANDPYQYRHEVLEAFIESWSPTTSIAVLPLAIGTSAKEMLLNWTEVTGREGVVFKRLNARYLHGRKSANVVKFKHKDDCDVIVLDKGVEGKDNLILGAYTDGVLVEVGHCTALNGDGPTIKKGDVITVNYVHFSKGGRLVQPTLPRLRSMDDKKAEDCTTDQFRQAYGK